LNVPTDISVRMHMSSPIRLKALFLATALAATTCVGCTRQDAAVEVDQRVTTTPAILAAGASNTQVRGTGIVSRLLPDDHNGSAHQRFILRLPSGQTLLIAHNTDLAPAIANLRVGDTIEYNGEFEWNPKGGVVHWTHHDPAHQHADGWLKHDGRVFQ
jgi:hypothetical protein